MKLDIVVVYLRRDRRIRRRGRPREPSSLMEERRARYFHSISMVYPLSQRGGEISMVARPGFVDPSVLLAIYLEHGSKLSEVGRASQRGAGLDDRQRTDEGIVGQQTRTVDGGIGDARS